MIFASYLFINPLLRIVRIADLQNAVGLTIAIEISSM
jgi:hypothetical protein